jgi:integrase
MAILAECPTCHVKQSIKNKKCKCGEMLDKAKSNRKIKYWIQYRLPDGRQKKESVGAFDGLDAYSISDAKDAHAKRRVQKKENKKKLLNILAESETTFNQLAEWFIDQEVIKDLTYFKGLRSKLYKFNAVYGDLFIDQIQPVDLKNYQHRLIRAGYQKSYVDQHIGAVKYMINNAFENGMVSGETVRKFKKVKKTLKRNANARDRVISRSEFDALMVSLSKLPKSDYLRAVVATAYYTGMRRSEILNLTWDKVDLQRQIICLDAGDTKDGEPRKMPVCGELVEILSALPNRVQAANKDNHLFLYRGKPVADIRTALKTACKDAKIIYGQKHRNGFVFHDLRHTFNTNMRKAGIAESVIMEITGHSTREMFDRYNTVDGDDRRLAVDQLEKYLTLPQCSTKFG